MKKKQLFISTSDLTERYTHKKLKHHRWLWNDDSYQYNISMSYRTVQNRNIERETAW